MANPISSTELMQHLRFTADAAELLEADAMIATATAFAEQYTGRKYVSQTLVSYFDAFPSATAKDPLILTGGVVSSVTSVTYYDTSYVQQTLAASRLINRNGVGRVYTVMGEEWPTDVAANEPDVVAVTYVAGMLPAAVPAQIKSAILLIAASLWENRENEIIGTNIKALKATIAAKDLLHPFKAR